MTQRDYASRDLNRDIISRTLATVNGEAFGDIPLATLKATFDANEKTFDKICELQASVLAQALGPAEKKEARGWLQVAEMDYKVIRMRLCERIDELGRREHPGRVAGAAQVPQGQNLGSPEGLGKFDGTHVNWPAFRDLFTALVDSRGYPALSKLLYLKKACTGPAALALSGYDPLGECYQDAWNALKAIYDDNYAVAQALIDRLLDMPKARDREVGELRRIIDTTTSTLRQLASLGHNVEAWSPLIVNVMTRKLPISIVDQWEQKRRREETPDLDDLVEFLEGKARLRLFSGEASRENPKNAGGMPGAGGRNRPSGNSNVPGGSNKRRVDRPLFRAIRPRLECRGCGQDHWLANCPELCGKPIPERRRALTKLGMCFNCLNFGHQATACGRPGCANGSCCGDKHHRLLCPSQNPRAANSQVRTITKGTRAQ